MGSTAGLDILKNSKISFTCRESNTQPSSFYPTHHKNNKLVLLVAEIKDEAND
jgi:hypothetical protein